MRLKIPERFENWTIETVLLETVMRLVGARRIFEFGTFRGASTMQFALNGGREIWTFDLPPGVVPDGDSLDAKVSAQRDTRQPDFCGIPESVRIHRLFGDSLTARFPELEGTMDFVFVDACHDYQHIKADTVNAFRLLKPSGPRAVAWHDYRNPDFPDVTAFLATLSQGKHLVGIDDARLCLWAEGIGGWPHLTERTPLETRVGSKP